MSSSPLSPRLAAIAALVPAPCAVADIGADHGHLSVALAAAGCRVVAVEVTEGPLRQLQTTVRAARRAAQVEVRLGDGLTPLAQGEVEAVCIAGMGGATIARILKERADLLPHLRRLVFQPMNAADTLRRALIGLGLELTHERVAWEGSRRYEILAAAPGDPERPYARCPAPRAVALRLGPFLVCQPDPATRRMLQERLDYLHARDAHIARSARDIDTVASTTREEIEALTLFLAHADAWADAQTPSPEASEA